MTPEREEPGRGPRQDKAEPALRFDKGTDIETPGQKAKGRPAGAWKKAAARMSREQRPPEAEPAAPSDPGPPADNAGPATSENGVPAKSADFVGRGGATERGDFGTLCPEGAERSLCRRVPKYRQHSKRETREPGASSEKFRRDSKQARPADKLHRDGGAGPQPSDGGKAGTDPGPEPDTLRKSRLRMKKRGDKLNAARDKLARQKPYKPPGPVRRAAGFAGRSVHGFAHGKVYEVEHENVGTEGAHRSELVAEAAGRRAVRFTKQRIRTHPARAVKKAEGRSVKATADYHFRQTVLEHPEMEKKNALSWLWRKRQQRKRYQKRAREAAKRGAKADLRSMLDNYEAAHSYDEYHFDLDGIEHDPYVLLSILSAFHPEGWTLAEVEADLQTLFDRQYILTESVEVEVRYRTETRTDSEGNTYDVEVPYNYYICTVTMENFNLSHVPVYIMGEDQLSRYALYMAALGNRPDLFPGSAYIGKYGGPVTTYDIPPEALEDEQFAAMIAEAEKYLGYPYVWGGSSPATSFDCSGFVSWVVNHCGVGWDVGRLGATGLYHICTPVSSANAKPGDLIFFQGTYDTDGMSHVGIYVGGGMMIHCGDPIQYANINTSYWQAHFAAFGRLP